MIKYYLIKNGKKVLVKKDKYPNGLYVSYRGDKHPILQNPDYEGFRMIFKSRETEPKVLGRCDTNYISDNIELKSMADGKMYSSKTHYYDSLKRNDSRIIEAGELEAGIKNMQQVRGDFNCRKELKQAIEQHLH